MTNERHRVPQDPEYFHTLGLARVCFARLEWEAVSCCKILDSDYIHISKGKSKAAGLVANDLKCLFSKVPNLKLHSKIIPFVDEFRKIVKARNDLMHAIPITSEGDQRLDGDSDVWTIDGINAFSDRCTKIEVSLNRLRYEELTKPDSV